MTYIHSFPNAYLWGAVSVNFKLYKKIKKPVAVRYAFNNTATPNLFSKDGLPMNLFRTDDWDIDTNTKSNN